MCSRFAFDSYEREVERYGGPLGIVEAEAVFAADSTAVAELLALGRDGRLGLDRTTLAVLSIDDLLAGLGLDEAQRLTWYRDRVYARHLTGPEFRQRGRDLRALLGDLECLCETPGGPAVSAVLGTRRVALEPPGRSLGELDARGELTETFVSLARSFVHLHCNRLLGSERNDEERALGLLLRTREGLERSPLRPA